MQNQPTKTNRIALMLRLRHLLPFSYYNYDGTLAKVNLSLADIIASWYYDTGFLLPPNDAELVQVYNNTAHNFRFIDLMNQIDADNYYKEFQASFVQPRPEVPGFVQESNEKYAFILFLREREEQMKTIRFQGI